MNTTADLKAQLAALDTEWEAKKKAIQHLRKYDRVQNEGGEGYSAYENAAEKLASEYLPLTTALMQQIFASEWTPEVTAERRAAWKAEIGKMSSKQIFSADLQKLIDRVGYSHHDIKRAMTLHGIT